MNSTEISGQGSTAGDSTVGSQAGVAKAGDVSTERKPGSLTNQHVPKNLTAEDSVKDLPSTDTVVDEAKKAVTNIATGSATGGAAGGALAAGGAIAAVGGFDDAMPQAKPGDTKEIKAVIEAVQNTSDKVSNASGLAPVRENIERALQDGLNISLGGNSPQRPGKTIMGSAQPAAAKPRLLDGAHISQLFGVVGALLFFSLWMFRRRRGRHHIGHVEPGLLGPGVSGQGISGWSRPRHHRHRLGND